MKEQVITIDPRKIRLLELNARYMRHEMFIRLVENIRRDQTLSQIPFGWHVHDDDTQEPLYDKEGEPLYEVLSGNHRVKAAVAADLPEIKFQVAQGYLTPDQRRAVQLSHNAISGEDDPAILKLVYDSIDDIGMKLYAGMDDAQLDLMQDAAIAPLSEANLTFQAISLLFLPDEMDAIEETLDIAKSAIAGSNQTWAARWRDYDAILDGLEAAGAAHNVRNTATTMLVIFETFTRHIEDLREAYLGPEGDPLDNRDVPIESVIASRLIPAPIAAKLNKVAEKMISRGELDKNRRWQVLDELADLYLEQ